VVGPVFAGNRLRRQNYPRLGSFCLILDLDL
jgi:hypothetical protein